MTTVDKLRAIQIRNVYELLARFADKGKDVACTYSPGHSRTFQTRGTQVCSPSHKTDPGGHWLDYGRKTFNGPQEESMPQAMDWASKKYGIDEWVPSPINPRSDKVPRAVRERALAAIKAQP